MQHLARTPILAAVAALTPLVLALMLTLAPCGAVAQQSCHDFAHGATLGGSLLYHDCAIETDAQVSIAVDPLVPLSLHLSRFHWRGKALRFVSTDPAAAHGVRNVHLYVEDSTFVSHLYGLADLHPMNLLTVESDRAIDNVTMVIRNVNVTADHGSAISIYGGFGYIHNSTISIHTSTILVTASDQVRHNRGAGAIVCTSADHLTVNSTKVVVMHSHVAAATVHGDGLAVAGLVRSSSGNLLTLHLAADVQFTATSSDISVEGRDSVVALGVVQRALGGSSLVTMEHVQVSAMFGSHVHVAGRTGVSAMGGVSACAIAPCFANLSAVNVHAISWASAVNVTGYFGAAMGLLAHGIDAVIVAEETAFVSMDTVLVTSGSSNAALSVYARGDRAAVVANASGAAVMNTQVHIKGSSTAALSWLSLSAEGSESDWATVTITEGMLSAENSTIRVSAEADMPAVLSVVAWAGTGSATAHTEGTYIMLNTANVSLGDVGGNSACASFFSRGMQNASLNTTRAFVFIHGRSSINISQSHGFATAAGWLAHAWTSHAALYARDTMLAVEESHVSVAAPNAATAMSWVARGNVLGATHVARNSTVVSCASNVTASEGVLLLMALPTHTSHIDPAANWTLIALNSSFAGGQCLTAIPATSRNTNYASVIRASSFECELPLGPVHSGALYTSANRNGTTGEAIHFPGASESDSSNSSAPFAHGNCPHDLEDVMSVWVDLPPSGAPPEWTPDPSNSSDSAPQTTHSADAGTPTTAAPSGSTGYISPPPHETGMSSVYPTDWTHEPPSPTNTSARAVTISAVIEISGNFTAILDDPSLRAQLEESFRTDISVVLGILREYVTIRSMFSGSVVVNYRVQTFSDVREFLVSEMQGLVGANVSVRMPSVAAMYVASGGAAEDLEVRRSAPGTAREPGSGVDLPPWAIGAIVVGIVLVVVGVIVVKKRKASEGTGSKGNDGGGAALQTGFLDNQEMARWQTTGPAAAAAAPPHGQMMMGAPPSSAAAGFHRAPPGPGMRMRAPGYNDDASML